MQFLATSGKPSTRSLDALLNSAASIRPRSSAGTISPPGSGLTAVPIVGEHVHREPDGAELEALHVLDLRHRLLEPAQRLRRHRAVEVGDHVEVEALVDLLHQRLAAAVVVPGQHHVRVHAEARARPPQRERRVLAVPVRHHAVAAVERALGDGIEQLEGRHHRARRQHLDLQSAPPAMSFTFLAKSWAYSWKMSLAGQVLWKRSVAGLRHADHGGGHGAGRDGGALRTDCDGDSVCCSVMRCLRCGDWKIQAAHLWHVSIRDAEGFHEAVQNLLHCAARVAPLGRERRASINPMNN